MAERVVNLHTRDTETQYEKAVAQLPEFSRMVVEPRHITSFNAGRLVPIYCREILPNETISINIDAVIREVTMKTPVLGGLLCDFYAFFVQNRNVNDDWKETMGENPNGAWYPLDTDLCALYAGSGGVQVPVGSIADYYGLPTQAEIPAQILQAMNDLRFRGYFMIWNEYFRDQNYQAPLPLSTENNTQSGFFAAASGGGISILQEPLRVNKLHDYFTSVLPSPQKGAEVFLPLAGAAPITLEGGSATLSGTDFVLQGNNQVKFTFSYATQDSMELFVSAPEGALASISAGTGSTAPKIVKISGGDYSLPVTSVNGLQVDLSEVSSVSISDFRIASATQRFYEQLARVGSRYREYVAGFFGIEVNNPMRDVPTYLGHLRRELEVYQTAQTSASESGSTPQGNLAAFSYSRPSGSIIQNGSFTAVEHGYLHIFVVIRQKNVYPSFCPPDLFRRSMLDFYQPQLANISEQPVYTRSINPFAADLDGVFGYQEAWAEYRDEPDLVSGLMRPGVTGSLSSWNYADEFDSGLTIADDDFMLSNAQEVVDRTVEIASTTSTHQFYGEFHFVTDKQLPMPVYSVPELE